MSELGDYVIWSNEHRCWWAPKRRGYTRYLGAAGRYTVEEANEICFARRWNPFTEGLDEVPVRAEEAVAFWPDEGRDPLS